MRKWLVLAAFALNTGFNAFMFMNFAAVSATSKDLLGVDNQQLNWIYSVALVAVLPLAFPAAYHLDKHNYATCAFSVLMNAAGAWLRYLGAWQKSYAVSVASSVPVGAAAAVIICTPTQLAEAWFPVHQKTLATSLAVQANYAGWLLGATITPHVVHSPSALEAMLFYQALASCAVVAAFVLFHRSPPKVAGLTRVLVREAEDGEDSVAEHQRQDDLASHHPPLLASAKILARNKHFVVQGLCFATLGGISFAVPAIQDQVFHDQGFSEEQDSFTNLSFILSGVATGVGLGVFVSPQHHRVVLSSLFLLCSLALTVLTVLSQHHTALSHHWLHVANLVCMGVAGASSLGFIGLALAVSAAIGAPVSETYSGGLVEWFLQVFAVVLTQIPLGFAMCCAVCWVVTLVLVAVYRRPAVALPG